MKLKPTQQLIVPLCKGRVTNVESSKFTVGFEINSIDKLEKLTSILQIIGNEKRQIIKICSTGQGCAMPPL